MAEGKDWPQPSRGDGDARCHGAREGQSRIPPARSTRSGAGKDEGPRGPRDGWGCSGEMGRGSCEVCHAGSHPAPSAPIAANTPAKIPTGISGSSRISRKMSHPCLNHPEWGGLAPGHFPSRCCEAAVPTLPRPSLPAAPGEGLGKALAPSRARVHELQGSVEARLRSPVAAGAGQPTSGGESRPSPRRWHTQRGLLPPQHLRGNHPQKTLPAAAPRARGSGAGGVPGMDGPVVLQGGKQRGSSGPTECVWMLPDQGQSSRSGD